MLQHHRQEGCGTPAKGDAAPAGPDSRGPPLKEVRLGCRAFPSAALGPECGCDRGNRRPAVRHHRGARRLSASAGQLRPGADRRPGLDGPGLRRRHDGGQGPRVPPSRRALSSTSGLLFVMAGIVVRVRRPDNRVGTLMVLTGFALFAEDLQLVPNPIVFSLAVCCRGPRCPSSSTLYWRSRPAASRAGWRGSSSPAPSPTLWLQRRDHRSPTAILPFM